MVICYFGIFLAVLVYYVKKNPATPVSTILAKTHIVFLV
jgi:hypothetical protein